MATSGATPSRDVSGDEASDSSSVRPPLAAKRKRGRPLTTGDYVQLAEAKRRLLELRERESALEAQDAVLDASRPASQPSRTSKPLPSLEEMVGDLRHQPTSDLGARLLEQADLVERVAGGSKGLQSRYVRVLRVAARTVTAAATELAARTSASAAPELEGENSRLRARVSELEGQVSAFRRELAEIRASLPALPLLRSTGQS